MAGSPTHGREGVLYLSTSTGSTAFGTEIGFTNSWTWTPTKDNVEITAINQTSKFFVEGLVSGTLAAEGSLLAGSAQTRDIIGRFAKVKNDTGDTITDTDALAITDGNFYFHCVMKPIDTKGTSDDVRGQKVVVPVLASGMSLGAAGADIVPFSYDGVQNGDVMYVESTSTAHGLPKKAV